MRKKTKLSDNHDLKVTDIRSKAKNEKIRSYFLMAAFSLSPDWSSCSSQQQQLFPI